MANKTLFSGFKSLLRRADTRNEAGGLAYSLPAKHALAQLAATGCFNGTYYADAADQLAQLLTLAAEVNDNTFLAKLAVYARERALMKDMPAALLLILSKRDTQLFRRAFGRVVDNGRVLRTMFQMLRSGQFGRKSLSYALQRAFQRWLNEASVERLLSASIGSDPSLRDVLRLARPTPQDNQRRALFGWLADKEPAKWARLRRPICHGRFRRSWSIVRLTPPSGKRRFSRVSMSAGISSPMPPRVWRFGGRLRHKMGPQALRMNLNTLVRHEAFAGAEGAEMVNYVAGRIADADEIRRSRQFPYQYLAAYLNAGDEVPQAIKAALHKAAETACGNVPELPGPVLIGLDVSGSMGAAVTGRRGRGATSRMRCVDVAALFAAAILRRNPDSVVVPFDTSAYEARVDSQDTILSLAERLAKYGGGGTNCSLPLAKANSEWPRRRFVGCVLVSDNESWVGSGRNGSTAVLTEWQAFVANQVRLYGRDFSGPKLVCINVQPYGTAQAPERTDILNVGGFSDAVFAVVSAFLRDDAARFVAEIDAIEL